MSHCAGESKEQRSLSPDKLKVAELKEALQALGHDTKGKKADLVARLVAARGGTSVEGTSVEESAAKEPEDEVVAKGSVLEVPGIAGVKMMRSAAAARKDKEIAGESRAIEHVAELDATQTGTQESLTPVGASLSLDVSYDSTAGGSVVDKTDLEGDKTKVRVSRAKRRLDLEAPAPQEKEKGKRGKNSL